MDLESKAKRPFVFLAVVLVLQAASLAVICFGDIGFDHPGKYGLDFDDFILIGLVYAASLILGLVLSLVGGRLLLAAAQLVVGVGFAAYAFLPW